MRIDSGLAVLALVLSSGCASRRGVQLATASSVSAISVWSEAAQKAVSEVKIGAPAATDEKGKRDLAIAYSTALIMAQYGTVRTSLMSGRAISSIAFDILDVGLTAAVPITNGSRGKTILGSLATGFKGTNLSIDRNLFNEQTTATILSAMDTCVLRQQKVIADKSALTIDRYTIYNGYADLTRLYGCTTLAGALQELSENQAGAAKQEQQREHIAPIDIGR